MVLTLDHAGRDRLAVEGGEELVEQPTMRCGPSTWTAGEAFEIGEQDRCRVVKSAMVPGRRFLGAARSGPASSVEQGIDPLLGEEGEPEAIGTR
jgi:hypothetical protein